MADKRIIRSNLKRIQSIKTWQLLILLLLALFLSATFLRLNNTGMIARQKAVISADKSGNTQEIMSRIYDLQRYSASHMNADTGALYLQEQYNRDVKAAVAAVSGSGDGSDSPQARADAICNPNLQSHGYSQAYQDCMLRELSREGQVLDPGSIKLPPPTLYRYSFAAPLWSPDFAGWSVLLSAAITLVIAVRLVVLVLLKIMLRRRYTHM